MAENNDAKNDISNQSDDGKSKLNGNKRLPLKILLITSLLFVLMLLIGATSATFVKTLEQRANNFTVGKVAIKLEEPNWEISSDKVTYPGREIEKDPQVTNTGVNDAYIYIEVQVPRFLINTYDDTGKIVIRVEPSDVFTFDVNNGWEQIDKYLTTDDKYTCYIYAYTAGIVRPNETTGTLFDSVKFINELEGQIAMGTRLEMPLHAYAIQCGYLDETGTTNREKMIDAFEKYKAEP